MGNIIRINGMVDPHVHLRGLDWSHKGTFASETTAAIAGGYWAVLDMPNTSPSTVNRETLSYKLAEIDQQAVCDWGLYVGATKDDNTSEYETVLEDVCGLKIYNNATTGDLLIADQTIREKHYQVWSATKPIAVHAEGDTVRDILKLVRQYRKPTHFCHLSTAEEIMYVREAKQMGLPISVGVTPHHLYLTQDDAPQLGSLGLMKPELKTKADQEVLWLAVQAGIVDVIESDHAPHTLAEKQSENPPYGVPGLETTLPLLGLALHDKRLSLEQICNLIAAKPREIFGLVCDEHTYTLVDFDDSYLISNDKLYTQCGWSPFAGMRVYGKVIEVWIRGQKVFDGEQVLIQPGFGKDVIQTQIRQ